MVYFINPVLHLLLETALCWPSKNCRKLMTVAGLGQKRRLTQWVNWNLSKTRW
jgi:hypothetical protein